MTVFVHAAANYLTRHANTPHKKTSDCSQCPSYPPPWICIWMTGHCFGQYSIRIFIVQILTSLSQHVLLCVCGCVCWPVCQSDIYLHICHNVCPFIKIHQCHWKCCKALHFFLFIIAQMLYYHNFLMWSFNTWLDYFYAKICLNNLQINIYIYVFLFLYFTY